MARKIKYSKEEILEKSIEFIKDCKYSIVFPLYPIKWLTFSPVILSNT